MGSLALSNWVWVIVGLFGMVSDLAVVEVFGHCEAIVQSMMGSGDAQQCDAITNFLVQAAIWLQIALSFMAAFLGLLPKMLDAKDYSARANGFVLGGVMVTWGSAAFVLVYERSHVQGLTPQACIGNLSPLFVAMAVFAYDAWRGNFSAKVDGYVVAVEGTA
eukprot:TRINITY_DN50910_c0_g1_i1.p1 TRINITY_DN50910_c0_g1~~TRINITY_DN50910_c0_g1_i1.p1  ORF type:complete len:162 (-),score=15.70 TRINITY_DN50910_c0_g1_i1:188-673(-)